MRSPVFHAGMRAFMAAFLMLLSLPASYAGSVQAQNSLIPANPYGVNVFLHKEVETAKIEKTLQMIAEANIPWVKQEFPWQEIEFKKGYFHDDKWDKSSWEKFDRIVDLADKYKLRVIARIDHAPDWAKAEKGNSPIKHDKDLSNFINAFLDHYKGRIQYVQVWNEPNLTGEWVPGQAVDPAEYAAMLKAVYPAVKAAHPDAVILSAPMAMTLEGPNLRGNMNEIDYWKGMYDAGVKGNFDIASANGYGLDMPPSAPPDPKVLNFRRVELLREVMVQNGDEGRPIWFDEFGWNASPDSLSEEEKNFWRHVSPQQQAQWTVEGVEYARQHWPWAGVVSIWYFRQVGDIPPEKAEFYFAMLNPDFSPQPVYDAVKADAMQYPGPVSQGQPAATQLPTEQPAQSTPTEEQPPVSPTPQPVVLSPTEPLLTATVAPLGTYTTGVTLTTRPVPEATPTSQVTPASPPVVVVTLIPTATAAVASAAAGGSNLLLYIVGGLLVAAGLAGVAFYFVKGRTPAS